MTARKVTVVIAAIGVAVAAIAVLASAVISQLKADPKNVVSAVSPMIRNIGFVPDLGGHYYQGRRYNWVNVGGEMVRAANNCTRAMDRSFDIYVVYMDLGFGRDTSFVVMCL